MTISPDSPGQAAGNLADGRHPGPGTADAPIPAPEHRPPYRAGFLAHLHGNLYEDLPEHADLWDHARADPDAAGILTALDTITA